MWGFVLSALALSVLAVALTILALRRGAVDADEDAQRAVRIYADPLREIERDAARGMVAGDEVQRLRTETARRLLDADRVERAALAPSPRGARGLAIALTVATPLVALGVYWIAGAPGLPDQPLAQRFAVAAELRAARPDQATLEARWAADPARLPAPEPDPEYAALMEQLRAAVAQRPGDVVGLRLLATNEANLGNHSAAAAAWIDLIEAQGPDAPVEDLAALAESMIAATGGLVSPEADTLLQRILETDPRNGTARYFLGLSFLQTERPDLTFRLWRGLLEDSEPDAPWVPAIRSTIEELAQVAGVRYTLPPLAGQNSRGPSAEDMANAAQMTEAERQDMIGGMVEGLAARLANQGGTPEEWARLINALGVLGQAERARAIWAEARLAFADNAAALETVDGAARAAGFLD